VRWADVASAIRTIYEDPAWHTGFDTFWEATGITELLFERDDLAHLIAVHREFATQAATGCEIIAVSRPLDYGMSTIYTLMMRAVSLDVRVCQSKTQAAQKLGRSL
jgi:hypothetical protein